MNIAMTFPAAFYWFGVKLLAAAFAAAWWWDTRRDGAAPVPMDDTFERIIAEYDTRTAAEPQPPTPARAPTCVHGWPGQDCGIAHPYMADPTVLSDSLIDAFPPIKD